MHINTRTQSRQFGCLQFQFNCLYLAMMFPFTLLRRLRHGNRCNWERFVRQKGNQYVINLPYNWNLPTMIFDVVYILYTTHDFYSLLSTQNPYNNNKWRWWRWLYAYIAFKMRKTFSAPIQNDADVFFKYFLQFSTRWMLIAWIGLVEPSLFSLLLHASCASFTHSLIDVGFLLSDFGWMEYSFGRFVII